MERWLLISLILISPYVLAQTTTWTAAIGGIWENGANWNNGVPQPGYNVIINTAYAVSASSFVNIQSLSISNGGSVRFDYIANIAGAVTLTGASTVDFRYVGTVGSVSLTGPSNFYLGTVAVVNVSTSFIWQGLNSVVGSAVGAGGKLNLLSTCSSQIIGSGLTQYLMYLTLTNYGYIFYDPTGEGVELYVGGTFINALGGVMNVTEPSFGVNVLFNTQASNLLFINRGTLNVQIHPLQFFQVYASFQNEGILNVISGTMNLQGTGTVSHTGTFNHQPGSFISFNGGVNNFQLSSVVSNGVGIIFNGGTHNIYGNFVPKYFQLVSLWTMDITLAAYWNC